MKQELLLGDEAVKVEEVKESKLCAEHDLVKALEERGISNIMEIYDVLEVFVMAGAKVFKDGKISFRDLFVLRDLLKSAKVMVHAIKGVKEIPGEVKDLSGEEISEIAARVLGTVDKFKAELEDR